MTSDKARIDQDADKRRRASASQPYSRVHVAHMSILRFRSFAELEYAERGFGAEVYIAWSCSCRGGLVLVHLPRSSMRPNVLENVEPPHRSDNAIKEGCLLLQARLMSYGWVAQS